MLTAKEKAKLEELAGIGLTWPQIAVTLGISKTTLLERRKEDEAIALAYQRGRARVDYEVGRALVKKAKKGDVAAIRWYEMTRAGRREGLSIAGAEEGDEDQEGTAYGPIQFEIVDPKAEEES